MITPEEYKTIYRKLDEISPVPFDCGTVCNAACCHGGDDDGIHLLPGEEAVHEANDWQSMEKNGTSFFVKCKGSENCNRSLRPIQCRTFPLMPVLNMDGKVEMVINDMELSYSCPLIDADAELDKDFVKVTREIWETLAKDPDIRKTITKSSD